MWRTQGPDKSLETVSYADKTMRDQRLDRRTLGSITDRDDLHSQLPEKAVAPVSILPKRPVQAVSRVAPRELPLLVPGSMVFMTARAFAPGGRPSIPTGSAGGTMLADQRNAVLIADEEHRSQNAFGKTLDAKGRLKVELAQHLRDALPSATHLGSTGGPIKTADKEPRAVEIVPEEAELLAAERGRA
jgi:type I restriction enzyme R subunit